jgi:WD40 repeat protein
MRSMLRGIIGCREDRERSFSVGSRAFVLTQQNDTGGWRLGRRDRTFELLTDRTMVIFNKEQQLTQAYALSPDCKQMGMAGEMGLIRIWDLGKQTAIASWEGHVGMVTSLAYSPDGSTLASGGLDGTVRLWSLEEQLKGKHE